MAETNTRSGSVESALKNLGALIALSGFLWGIWTYQDTSRKQLARERTEAARYADTRRIEALKPYLERQLKLYTDATQVAATISTQEDGPARSRALKRFWELYWGELALVEDATVEKAMVAFGAGLKSGLGHEEMKRLSLTLAHACRDSLAASWKVAEWKRPAREAEPRLP